MGSTRILTDIFAIGYVMVRNAYLEAIHDHAKFCTFPQRR